LNKKVIRRWKAVCSKETLNEILAITVKRLKEIFKGSLVNVILNGSYASGDHDNESILMWLLW